MIYTDPQRAQMETLCLLPELVSAETAEFGKRGQGWALHNLLNWEMYWERHGLPWLEECGYRLDAEDILSDYSSWLRGGYPAYAYVADYGDENTYTPPVNKHAGLGEHVPGDCSYCSY
jgi:hypothetical protein